MSGASVKFHFIGRYAPGELTTQWVPDSRPRIGEIEAGIERAWGEALARPRVKLFDGPLCRLESFRAGATLELSLSRTSYKPFLGTNLRNSHYADKYGPDALANAVGLSSALESADGFVMLGRRNSAVAYYPGRVHPFAGSLEPHSSLDVFAEVRRELAEEVGLPCGDVAEIACIGMAEDISVRQPELIFRVRSARTRAEIEGTLDAAEHQGCVAVEQRAETVAAALGDRALTPIAVATLLLWGRGRFGGAWFDAASGADTLGGL